MTLDTKKKQKIIKEVAIHDTDTGSVDVQAALLSETIDKLVSHLKKHTQDVHSKRGLIKMVIKRKKLLADLKKTDEKRYTAVVKKIGLKK
jgi:small subunit ribosomal protein S15